MTHLGKRGSVGAESMASWLLQGYKAGHGAGRELGRPW